MKNRFAVCAILVMGVILQSCGSGTKNEWGILQQIEADRRSAKLDPLVFESVGEYNLAGISTGSVRVWVLLNPRHAPFYKQLPNKAHYTITEDQLAKIEAQGASETVIECLKSHVLEVGSSR